MLLPDCARFLCDIDLVLGEDDGVVENEGLVALAQTTPPPVVVGQVAVVAVTGLILIYVLVALLTFEIVAMSVGGVVVPRMVKLAQPLHRIISVVRLIFRTILLVLDEAVEATASFTILRPLTVIPIPGNYGLRSRTRGRVVDLCRDLGCLPSRCNHL